MVGNDDVEYLPPNVFADQLKSDEVDTESDRTKTTDANITQIADESFILFRLDNFTVSCSV